MPTAQIITTGATEIPSVWNLIALMSVLMIGLVFTSLHWHKEYKKIKEKLK